MSCMLVIRVYGGRDQRVILEAGCLFVAAAGAGWGGGGVCLRTQTQGAHSSFRLCLSTLLVRDIDGRLTSCPDEIDAATNHHLTRTHAPFLKHKYRRSKAPITPPPPPLAPPPPPRQPPPPSRRTTVEEGRQRPWSSPAQAQQVCMYVSMRVRMYVCMYDDTTRPLHVEVALRCVKRRADAQSTDPSPLHHTTAASKAPATTTTQHRPPAIGLPSPASSSSIEPPTPAGFYKADSTVFDIDLVEGACHVLCTVGVKGTTSTWWRYVVL